MIDDAQCSEALKVALQLGAKGYHCFPCGADKTPKIRGGFRGASPDARRLKALWAKRPGPLVGVATGAKSDLLVVDVDSTKHEAAAAWLEKHEQQLAPFRRHATRSGGCHYLFKHRPGLKSRQAIAIDGCKVQGLDLRAEGGYIIWWPCAEFPAVEAPIAPLPDWLLRDLMRGVRDKAAEQAEAHYTSILPGLLASRAYRALSPATQRLHLYAETRFRLHGFTLPSDTIEEELKVGSSTVSAAKRDLRSLEILKKIAEEKRPGHPDAPPGKGLAALHQLPHRLPGAKLGVGDTPWRREGDPWHFQGQWRIHSQKLLAICRRHSAAEIAILIRLHLCNHTDEGGIAPRDRLELSLSELRGGAMSESTARRAVLRLMERGLVEQVAPAAGRRGALFRLTESACQGVRERAAALTSRTKPKGRGGPGAAGGGVRGG